MKSYAIYGASGCGRGVMPLVRQQLQLLLQSGDVDLVFVDDKPTSAVVNGQRVLTYAQWMAEPASSRHVCIAIANSHVREQLTLRCTEDGVNFTSDACAKSNVVFSFNSDL